MRNASDITNAVKALDQLYHLSHDDDCALMAEGVQHPETVCDCCLQDALAEVRLGIIAATKLDGLAAPRATPEDERPSGMPCAKCGALYTTMLCNRISCPGRAPKDDSAAPRARDWRFDKTVSEAREAVNVARRMWRDEFNKHCSVSDPTIAAIDRTLDALCDAVARYAGDSEDSKRMDWMQSRLQKRGHIGDLALAGHFTCVQIWTIERGADEQLGDGDNLRAAIDAAMRVPVSPTEAQNAQPRAD